MDKIPFPVIRPEDYDAFFRLTDGDLPDTHNKWLDLDTKSRRKRREQGTEVVEVKVHPHEFAVFCKAHNVPANQKTLADFAMHEYRTKGK